MKAFLEALTLGERDRTLAAALGPPRPPEHIAIIMDGNNELAAEPQPMKALGVSSR
jgi:undecaprenyl pyrophosphate synthase